MTPQLADVAEWTEYARGQEIRAERAEARVRDLEETLELIIEWPWSPLRPLATRMAIQTAKIALRRESA